MTLVHSEQHGSAILVLPAHFATPEAIAFLVRHSSGFIQVTVGLDVGVRLRLPMISELPSRRGPLVSVDAAAGIGTGISAKDRAHTVRLLSAADSAPQDFSRPGHVVPFLVHPRGVLGRPDFPEAAADVATADSGVPIAAWADLVADNSLELPSVDDSMNFAHRHDIRPLSLAQLMIRRVWADGKRTGLSESAVAADDAVVDTDAY